MRVKTYVVLKADRESRLTGEVLAVKLTFSAAQRIAKENAPAKVELHWADKFEHYTRPTR